MNDTQIETLIEILETAKLMFGPERRAACTSVAARIVYEYGLRIEREGELACEVDYLEERGGWPTLEDPDSVPGEDDGEEVGWVPPKPPPYRSMDEVLAAMDQQILRGAVADASTEYTPGVVVVPGIDRPLAQAGWAFKVEPFTIHHAGEVFRAGDAVVYLTIGQTRVAIRATTAKRGVTITDREEGQIVMRCQVDEVGFETVDELRMLLMHGRYINDKWEVAFEPAPSFVDGGF